MNMLAYTKMSYGVYVVSSLCKDKNPVGCIANSTMQVTAEPATIAVSINKENYTHESIVNEGKFVVNVLPEEIDAKIIGTFGFSSSRTVNKFSEVDYQMIDGLPVLSESCAYFICNVISSMDCGTHTIFLGEVADCDTLEGGNPMTYSYYHKVVKGRAPKTAPTYIPESELPQSDENAGYICSVCSYEYDGDIPFEDLPDDYECPICAQKKAVFTQK